PRACPTAMTTIWTTSAASTTPPKMSWRRMTGRSRTVKSAAQAPRAAARTATAVVATSTARAYRPSARASGRDYHRRVTELRLTTKNPARISADALVLAVGVADGEARLLADHLPSDVAQRLSGLLRPLGVSGKADEVLRVPAGDGVAA